MSEARELEHVDTQTGEIREEPTGFSFPTYERSESLTRLAVALVKAQSAMGPALKTSRNTYHGSNYSDLATVWEAAQHPLAENGLAVIQPISSAPDGKAMQVTTLLVHVSGEWISSTSTWPARAEKPKDRNGNVIQGAEPFIGPQALGSAATYGRRYGLAALLSIVSEDDDGEGAEGRRNHPHPEPAKPPRRTPAAPAKQTTEPAPAQAPPDPPASAAAAAPPEPGNVAQFPAAADAPPSQRAELLAQVSALMKGRLSGDKSTQAKVQLMKMTFGKEKWSEVCVLPIPQLLTGLALLGGGKESIQ